MTDEHVQRVRRERRVIAPDPLVDQPSREHLTRVAKKELEQLELDRAQLDLSSAATRVARQQVELEIGKRDRLGSGAGATKERADPRDQLLVRERLDQIVVGAGLETRRPGRAPRPAQSTSARAARSPSARSCSQTSIPSLPGIITSSTIASNARARSRARASSPSAATSTSNPCETSTRRSAFRNRASSSTTRIAMGALCVRCLKRT